MSLKFRKPKPVTEAQRAAARANGAKSHGPVTGDGKSKSALNAVKHGLASNALVLSTESRERMDTLHQAYRDEYQPQGQTENDLVDELTAAKWLQRRCWAMESALLDLTMDRMESEVNAEFRELGNAARHARDYHRALDKLRLIQKERREAAPTPQTKPEKPVLPNEPKREQPQSIEQVAAQGSAMAAAAPMHQHGSFKTLPCPANGNLKQWIEIPPAGGSLS